MVSIRNPFHRSMLATTLIALGALHPLTSCKAQSQQKLQSIRSDDVTATQLATIDPELRPLSSFESSSLRHEFPEPFDQSNLLQLGGGFIGVWGNAVDVPQIEAWARYFRPPAPDATLARSLLGTPRDIAEFIFAGSKEDLRRPTGPGEGIGSLRAAADSNGVIQCQFFSDKYPKKAALEADYGVTVFSGLLDGAEYVPALLIHHLLTAPWNLGIAIPGEYQAKVRGAGTACMRLAAMESLRTPFKGRIILESSLAAYQFYLNLGFVVIGKRELEGGAFVPLLWLSPAAAEMLAQSTE